MIRSKLTFFRSIRELRRTATKRTKRVVVAGVRGFPNVEGGVETHCANLYPRLAEKQYDVIMLARAPYVGSLSYSHFGVLVLPFWSPLRTGLEAMVHTFLAVFVARYLRAEIFHIHAIGPALFAPIARLLGMEVVVTHHGPDYDREKWGGFAKRVLKLGEYLGVKYATKLIVISKTIELIVETKYGRFDAVVIPNGVILPKPRTSEQIQSTLAGYQLSPNGYILSVGRLVPEKCFHDLVEAMKGSEKTVVIAGSIKDPTSYSISLRKQAEASGALLAGFVSGEALSDLYYGASLFVLASSHEGLPIALLEAMSHGINVLVSDIPANVEIGLPDSCYFRVGNIKDLREKAEKAIRSPVNPNFVELVKEKYDWDLVAQNVAELYGPPTS